MPSRWYRFIYLNISFVLSSHSHNDVPCQFGTRLATLRFLSMTWMCVVRANSKLRLVSIRARLLPVSLAIACRVIASLGIQWIWPAAQKRRARLDALMSARRHSSEYWIELGEKKNGGGNDFRIGSNHICLIRLTRDPSFPCQHIFICV